MSNKTTISCKVDKTLKVQAQQTASAIGIPLSTLINAYLNNVVATGRVEFTATENITPQMERIIKEVEVEISKNEPFGPFDNADKMINLCIQSQRDSVSKYTRQFLIKENI